MTVRKRQKPTSRRRTRPVKLVPFGMCQTPLKCESHVEVAVLWNVEIVDAPYHIWMTLSVVPLT